MLIVGNRKPCIPVTSPRPSKNNTITFQRTPKNTHESRVDTVVPKFSVCLLWLSSQCSCGNICLENKRGRCPRVKMQKMTKLISV
ncbi:hypothetical protein ACRRTK_022658 [Alexandromys fortis]